MGAVAPFVGRIYDRRGPVPLTTIGASLLTLMLWRFSTISAETPVPLLLAMHLTLTLGMALLSTPLMTTAMNPLPRRLYSHGSATMSTLQQVAGAMGVALLVTVMSSRAASLGASVGPELAQAAGLRTAFGVASLFALTAVILTLFLRTSVAKEEEEAPAVAQAETGEQRPVPL